MKRYASASIFSQHHIGCILPWKMKMVLQQDVRNAEYLIHGIIVDEASLMTRFGKGTKL